MKGYALAIMICLSGCNDNATVPGTDTIPAQQPPALKPVTDTTADTSGISSHDRQYIDLMIPQDAMVEIYYNGSKAELPYIESLKKYMATKKTIIKIFEAKDFPFDAKPVGRLYIHDTGDHRYELYIL